MLYNFSSAIRFDLHVLDDERCFIEELPKETQQFWNYRVEYYDATKQTHTLTPPGFGLRVHVKREAYGLEAGGDTTLLSKVYGNEGQFTYTAAENGKHKICFKAEASNAQMFDKYRYFTLLVNIYWYSKIRLVVHKRRGHDQTYFQAAAKEEDLTEVGVRVTKILDQLQQISVRGAELP